MNFVATILLPCIIAAIVVVACWRLLPPSRVTRQVLGYMLVGIVSALVANVLIPQATRADQFKFGTRVTQIGDMVPQSTAQMTFNFEPIAALGIAMGAPLDQSTAGIFAKKVAAVSGVATFTWTAGLYTSAPICNATPEATDASDNGKDYIVVTSTSCVWHSGDSADTRTVDFNTVGNPN